MKRYVSVGTAVWSVVLAIIFTFSLTAFALPYFLSDGNIKLNEVMRYIDTYYIADYDKSVLQDAAVKGAIDALPDKWSRYMTKEEYKESLDPTVDDYVGIGVVGLYDTEANAIRVSAVYPDSPASKCGIKHFDLITAVEGTLVSELGLDKSGELIRGKAGTPVNLTYYSISDGSTNTVTITRERVTERHLHYELMDNGIGYIRIEKFSKKVDVQFADAINDLMANGATGLIFDVRFNGGGRIDVMKNMLDPLLPEGKIIEQRDKSGKASVIMSDANELDIPMAVLVNEYSFSAAEFFAAALGEYDKATVVGTRTSGKNYSQNIFPLSDGSALVLSSYHYFTPKGVDLAENGVTPDVVCDVSDEELFTQFYAYSENDKQLTAAIESIVG